MVHHTEKKLAFWQMSQRLNKLNTIFELQKKKSSINLVYMHNTQQVMVLS